MSKYWLPRLSRALVRAALANRKKRCDPKCRGWFLDGDTGRPTRCDECASINGYARQIGDDDIGKLPEARYARRKADAWFRVHGART